MLTYQGFFEKGKFVSPDVAEIPERKRVILIVLDESMQEEHENKQAKVWRDFFDTVNASSEEVSL